jgi:acyl carrier protein
MPEQDAIRINVKRLIVASLNLEGMTPERIGDDDRLFGEGLGLDSVDALELVVALEKEYGISVASHEVGREVFTSVATLAAFVAKRLEEKPTPSAD